MGHKAPHKPTKQAGKKASQPVEPDPGEKLGFSDPAGHHEGASMTARPVRPESSDSASDVKQTKKGEKGSPQHGPASVCEEPVQEKAFSGEKSSILESTGGASTAPSKTCARHQSSESVARGRHGSLAEVRWSRSQADRKETTIRPLETLLSPERRLW